MLVPEEILSALEDNSLVIFTGAGISIDPPSNLPLFMGLAEYLVERVQSELVPNSDEWRDRLDALLGQLDEDPNLNIHELTRRRLTEATSEPNDTHKALMRIVARGTPRVVSTNYDLHLSTVANALSMEIETYRAPALPLGSDVKGLVYLHGAADGPADRLIVTDRDFGHAYLRQAWATRFLTDLFGKFTVLFVGYSHSDVVMRYLGLALGRDTSRYVMTSNPDDPMWTRLGIKPIGYPASDGDHSALTECLLEWAELAEMGLLEHKQRIRALLETPGDLNPSQQSYLEASICRADRVGFFREYAKDGHWLEWAATQPVFQSLFSRDQVNDEVIQDLARWFAEGFATASEEASNAAWAVLTRAGGYVSVALWSALAYGLHRADDGPRPVHHQRWLRLLMWQDRPECDAELIEYALVGTDPATEPDLALDLFTHLIQPHATPTRGYGVLGPTLEVQTRGSEDWLTVSLEKVIRPLMETRARDILASTEAALKQHYVLEDAINGHEWDRFSRHRAAIQPHSQDRYREPLDSIIDAARDSLIQLSRIASDEAAGIAGRWLTSPYALLRRLALYLHSSASLDSADAKVDLALRADLFNDRDAQQEAYELLRSAAAEVSDEAVARFLRSTNISELDEYGRYRWFQVLTWLRKHGARSPAIGDAVSELASLDPDLREEAHPGFRRWMEGGGYGGATPMESEAFHESIVANPASAVAYIQSFEPALIPREGVSRLEDAVNMLADAVRTYPSDGLLLWPHVVDDLGLQGTIIKAWAFAAEPELQRQILTLMLDLDLTKLLHELTQFFMNASRDVSAGWLDVEGIDDLILATWKAAALGPIDDSPGDWVGRVINSPVGCMVDFWFQKFFHNWASERESWTALRPDHRAFFETILGSAVPQRLTAVTEIAGRVHNLYDIDPQWCRDTVLPMADWSSDAKVAGAFWWGFLSFGRWNPSLLKDGLLEGLITTSRHLDEFGDDQRRRWCNLLAAIALTADPAAGPTWVDRFTATIRPDHRREWTKALSNQFRDLPPEARQQNWQTWLHDYWARRSQADPVVLAPAEASELAKCVPWLPAQDVPGAVDLVEASSAALTHHASWLRQIPVDFLAQPPPVVSRFFVTLMNQSERPFYGAHYLAKVLRPLVEREGDWGDLNEAAIRMRIALD